MPRSQKYRGLRRTANRRAIMDAAEELFGRHGYAAVSVDEVTAQSLYR
jgi:AcrR family transcriptional regulator